MSSALVHTTLQHATGTKVPEDKLKSVICGNKHTANLAANYRYYRGVDTGVRFSRLVISEVNSSSELIKFAPQARF
jgi:hypothetical protein